MPADIIQANYSELDEIASRFSQHAEASTALQSNIARRFEALEQGGWIGRGAEAFFSEMTSEIFPAIQRMIAAFNAGQEVTLQLKQIVEQAEQEAAAIYDNAGDAVQGGIGGGAVGMGGGGGMGMASASMASTLPPPRVYVINGINSSAPDGTPDGSVAKLEKMMEDNGYNASQVTTVPAIYNTNLTTNLQSTTLRGTRFGGLLSPLDWLTDKGADLVNGVTGIGGKLVNGGSVALNTAVGVGEVVQEYRLQDRGKYTQETYNFIREDLARNPLAPGQSVMLIGHSGGGAVAANLAPMLENNLRRDVSGVVSLGSPVANADVAQRYAHYVSISDANDHIGQPRIRSDEGRRFVPPALVGGLSNPLLLPGLAAGTLAADQLARDPGGNYFVTRDTRSNMSAHSSYMTSTEVLNILSQQYPELQIRPR